MNEARPQQWRTPLLLHVCRAQQLINTKLLMPDSIGSLSHRRYASMKVRG